MVAQQRGHRERREAGHQGLALPEHIAAANDRCDRRRKRGGPANAEPLQFLDKRRFGITGWRRGLVLLWLGVEEDACRSIAIDLVAHAALRQYGFLLFELRKRIVATFHVGAAEARKFDGFAAGRK